MKPLSQGLLNDCRALSSGTIATLTGVANYDRLASIQLYFVVWAGVEIKAGRLSESDSWQDAWNRFWGNY